MCSHFTIAAGIFTESHQPLSVCVFLPLTNFRKRPSKDGSSGACNCNAQDHCHLGRRNRGAPRLQGEEVIQLGRVLHGTAPLMLPLSSFRLPRCTLGMGWCCRGPWSWRWQLRPHEPLRCHYVRRSKPRSIAGTRHVQTRVNGCTKLHWAVLHYLYHGKS